MFGRLVLGSGLLGLFYDILNLLSQGSNCASEGQGQEQEAFHSLQENTHERDNGYVFLEPGWQEMARLDLEKKRDQYDCLELFS